MMNTRAGALLAGCILALFVGYSVGAYCSTSAINRCVTPFEDKWTTAAGAEVFNYYTDSQFEEMCDDYYKYEDCLKPFKHSCDSTQRAVFEGEEKGFGYACGKGAEVYLRNNKCYLENSVQKDGGECVSTFERAQRRLIDQLNNAWTGSEVHDAKEGYCDAVDDVLKCIKNVLAYQCGSEIAEWQYTVDKKLLGPLMDQLDCDSDESSQSHWVIVGIIFACLFFLALVVGCTSIFMWKKKKATARNRDQVVSHHGMAMQQQQQPVHVSVLPMTGPPQPPSYVEKVPTYQPAGAPSISPSAPPPYSQNNYESLQQAGGIDNPTYKH